MYHVCTVDIPTRSYNPTKGQLISKAIYGLLTSPKKRTDEFVLFAFLLFTANKSNYPFIFWENLRLANLLFEIN